MEEGVLPFYRPTRWYFFVALGWEQHIVEMAGDGGSFVAVRCFFLFVDNFVVRTIWFIFRVVPEDTLRLTAWNRNNESAFSLLQVDALAQSAIIAFNPLVVESHSIELRFVFGKQ